MISLRIFGTPVKVKFIVFVYFFALWGGLTWLGVRWHPDRTTRQASSIGLGSTILLLFADIGHAIAHTFSARYAGAPMDEILITEGMPRTIYWNNEVSPNVHRLRALGGPIFNLFGLLLSLAIQRLASRKLVVRELATWSAMGHGLLLIMSLFPLPIVDGGTLLKWTLVSEGRSETEANEVVRRVDWGMGIAVAVLGVGLLFLQVWAVGLILIGAGIVVIGIAEGKIR